MKPRGNGSDSSELALFWNRKLREEGLGVFRRGREIPLPPERIERLRPVSPPRGHSPRVSIPLEVLSPRELEVLELLFFEGLSERRAAALLGISRSSVKSYKKGALRKLRKRMS